MVNEADERWLYCYDIETGIWTKEDKVNVEWMVMLYNDLILKTDTGVYSVDGLKELTYGSGKAEPNEPELSWHLETVDFLKNYIDRKYIKNIKLRLELSEASTVRVMLALDGAWQTVKMIDTVGVETYYIPVKQTPCDSFKIRLEGRGDVIVHGISFEFVEGANV